MRRFKLNKTQLNTSNEHGESPNFGLSNPTDAKFNEQRTKIETLLKESSNSEQLNLFREIMQTPIENYDAKLVEFIPNKPPSDDYTPTSSFSKHKPKSLAEATLITNFQLFSYGCQTILSSCVPLIIEQYKLSLLQKNTQSDHLQQLEVVKFGHELSQRLVMPYQAYNQDFANELERVFKLCLNDVKLPEELEKQELTLGRIDYAREKITEQLILDHVGNYPILSPNQQKNSNLDKFIDHQQFFMEDPVEKKQKLSQNEQMLRIIDKLKLRKEQLIKELNE